MMLNGDLSRDINKEQGKVVISERKALVPPSLNASIDEGYKEPKEKGMIISIKKNTTAETQTLDLTPYLRYSVGDLKRIICQKEIEQGKQIRIIYQGRQLKEDDKVEDSRIKEGTFMHIFISDPPAPQKEVNITTLSAELFEPERRGFDKFRPLDIMEEEIILFRGKFHAKFIAIADKQLINENDLYKEEEEWIKVNEEYLLDTESVRETIRNYVDLEAPVSSNLLSGIAGFFMGLIFNVFFVIFLIYMKEKSPSFTRGYQVGCFLFLFLFILYKVYPIDSINQ